MSLLFAVQGSCECFDVAARITDQNSRTVAKKTAAKLIPNVPANASLGLTRRRDAMRCGHLTQGTSLRPH